MSDLAYRPLGESPGGAMPTASTEKYYPSISLNLEDFPELKGLDIGDGVEVCFKAKVRSKHESESYSDVCLDLTAGAIYEVNKPAPVISKTVAIAIKNEADTALDAITSLKRVVS